MKRIISILAFSASLMFAAPILAQDTASPVAQAEAKSTLTTANAMINYGRANNDALAMIAGVKLMVAVAEGTTIESGGTAMDLGAVLDEAVAMGGDDALILAQAEALRDDAEAKSRGACYWEYYCDWYGYCEYWYVCF